MSQLLLLSIAMATTLAFIGNTLALLPKTHFPHAIDTDITPAQLWLGLQYHGYGCTKNYSKDKVSVAMESAIVRAISCSCIIVCAEFLALALLMLISLSLSL